MTERKEASIYLSLFALENMMDCGVTVWERLSEIPYFAYRLFESPLDPNSKVDDSRPRTPSAEYGPSITSPTASELYTKAGRAIFLLSKTRFITPILGKNPPLNEFSVKNCISTRDDKSVISLSPTAMEKLQLVDKDIVLMSEKRGHDDTLLVLADEDCRDTIVKTNEAARKDLCVNPGDPLAIRTFPGTIKYGLRIQFRPLDNTDWNVVNNLFEGYLKPYFRDACRPISKDDLFLANNGTSTVKFKVMEIDPPDYCVVSNLTCILCHHLTMK
ncbi:3643_t:CDS:2 [Paraglomus occultum]|uniref:3643_t:CDS:1 n=1 Tax=Paraglomus occultum TaxID=144539 RepID=A0A9N9B3U1_9GLOM|nr:3643_t:CDS:2 [Paraglomus occultum]